MFPYDETQVLAFIQDAVVLYTQAHRTPDPVAGVWVSRMQFDAVYMGYPASRAKHLIELMGALGLPIPDKPPVSAGWKLCGSTPGSDLVSCVHDAVKPASTPEGAFEVTKRVAWLLRAHGYGLLRKDGGENIVTWNGVSCSAGRICMTDGHVFKILTDVPTTNGPTWSDNGFVDKSFYVPAMDPDV